MADSPKPKGKLPKWAIPVGLAGAAALIIVARKRKPTQGKATEPGAEGLTNQSFIPVTGENVPGAGASYFPSSSANNEGALVNFLKEQNEREREYGREAKTENQERLNEQRTFYQELVRNLGTGGGSPTSGGVPGISTAPAPEAATPPSPPPVTPPAPAPAPPPAPKCPSDYPDYNPLAGAVGPHSCYKYSRERCSNPAYPYKHVYQDGHIVCSPV